MDGPRLIKGLHAEYIPASWGGVNTSEIETLGTTVLVLTDKCSPISSGEAGRKFLEENGDADTKVLIDSGKFRGIHLPSDIVERMDAAAESGVLVDVSPGAFRLDEDGFPWRGRRPEPGDRIYIEKFAGKFVRGDDGVMYRLMDYKSVGAIFKRKADVKAVAA